ncbi:MAG: hypothetical protein HKN21_01675, partial [Candidatus Eisenbacteria bacterium]|nr:hypothetical protein [Candidatus Eisenbacteria bacterium]
AKVGAFHCLLQTEAEADMVLAKARAGADFKSLVEQYSIDAASKDISGALGYIQEGKIPNGFARRDMNFESKVLPLEEGELVKVETALGWHVVKAGPREGGGMKPLSEVYDEIATLLRRANFGDVYNDELQLVRAEFEAGVLSKGIEEYTGVERNAARLMEGVRSETLVPETRARIELARRVSSDLNAREYAPECLFWIAYLEITKNGNQRNCKKALDRLDREHPKSDWKKAGDLLRPYTDPQNFTVDEADLPLALDSPQEFLEKATS